MYLSCLWFTIKETNLNKEKTIKLFTDRKFKIFVK
jgi:hypothetical protein